MRIRPKRSLLAALAAALVALAGGCFLTLLLLTVTEAEGDTILDLTGAFFASRCETEAISKADLVECRYGGGLGELLSLFSLYSDFGLFGLLVDPVIVQVPTPVSNVVGSFDDGGGPRPLIVTETTSFDVDAVRTVTAEPGTTFLVFELPPDVVRALPPGSPAQAPGFDFAVSFTVPSVPPIAVKPMLAVRIDVADRTFFVPQIPCVTDFAAVPAVTLPGPVADLDFTPTLLAAFDGVTGCQGEFFSFSGVELAHFDYLLWKAKPDAKPAATLSVTDALAARDVDVKKTALLGTPADRDLRNPTAPLAPDHLVAYKVKRSRGQPREPQRRGVEVANLFGTQTLDLKKADLLLLPAAKDLIAPVPPLAAPGVNAFHCWRAKYAKGGGRAPKNRPTQVGDQLGFAQYTLKKPTRLCLPADVDGASPGAEADPVALACFKVTARPGPPGRDGVHTHDAVGPAVLRLKKPAELCLPSTVLL